MLKAILFDLDDTLMPDESAADAALAATALMAKVWHNMPPADIKDSVRRIAREVWRGRPPVDGGFNDISSWEALSSTFDGADEAMETLRNWVPEYRYEVWSRALADNGIADPLLVDQMAAAYPLERKSRYAPFPDVLPVLAELKAQYRLGCVTNGPCDLQCEKLARSGLEPFFEVKLISRVVGIAKPDPRIFAMALERLETAPGDAVFVGDSPKHDIVGAHAAGIRAVWLNRDRRPAVDGMSPDAEIATLPELGPVLARLG